MRAWRFLTAVVVASALIGAAPAEPAVAQAAIIASTAPAALVDINRASLADLKALPGMGEEYARRIVAGRPYRAKNQLTQRGILPDAAYRKIKDRIVAHRVGG
jgi:DNA uptake protein ComE-like DNA-binding protein